MHSCYALNRSLSAAKKATAIVDESDIEVYDADPVQVKIEEGDTRGSGMRRGSSKAASSSKDTIRTASDSEVDEIPGLALKRKADDVEDITLAHTSSGNP